MSELNKAVGGTPSPEKKKKLTNLQKRAITAACYILIWLALCAMKWCVPSGGVAGGWGSIGFDLAFCFVSVMGAFEFLRAIDRPESGTNCRISTPQRSFTIAFCAMVVPLFVAVEMTMGGGLLAVACAFTVYVMFLAATSVFDHNRSSVKSTIYCVFCMLYCGVLSVMLSAINHLKQNSMVAVLVLFMCTVLTDTGAFVVGSLLKKYIPMKLAPQLSPNKTVVGCVGGIIGGIAGGLLAYYVMVLLGGLYNGVDLVLKTSFPAVLSFILVGLATSVMSQIGDLFESAIKRECGIKDMGNILPGHGGILDRFDSMLYCSVVVLLSFGTII